MAIYNSIVFYIILCMLRVCLPFFRQIQIPDTFPEIRDFGTFITPLLCKTGSFPPKNHQVTSAGMSHLLGVTAHNFHHLSLLIILCGACATLPLPLAQFIPHHATWAHHFAETETEEIPQSPADPGGAQLPVPAENDAEGGQRCTGEREVSDSDVPMLGEAAMPAGWKEVLMKLVGGLEHDLYFSIWIGNVIIPIDFHIFQRGRSTTRKVPAISWLGSFSFWQIWQDINLSGNKLSDSSVQNLDGCNGSSHQSLAEWLLVGGLELFSLFHILGIIIPIDEYFSQGQVNNQPDSYWMIVQCFKGCEPRSPAFVYSSVSIASHCSSSASRYLGGIGSVGVSRGDFTGFNSDKWWFSWETWRFT